MIEAATTTGGHMAVL